VCMLGDLYLIVVNTSLSRCCRSPLLLQERLREQGIAREKGVCWPCTAVHSVAAKFKQKWDKSEKPMEIQNFT
jgi:hypothetical protein